MTQKTFRCNSYNRHSPVELLLSPNVTDEWLFALETDFSVMEEVLDVEEALRLNLPTTHFCKMLW